MNEELNLVCIYKASSETEANLVKNLIESEGIQVVFRSDHSASVYDGVFRVAMGYWAELMVREDQAEEALRLIRAFHEQNG